MTIQYNNKTGNIEAHDITPEEDPFDIKEFTLTGTNNTDKAMPYNIYLVIDNNTFGNDAISYTLESENVGNSGQIASALTNNIGINSTNILLGMGYFNNSKDIVHKYILKLYYLDNGEKQNTTEKFQFAAHINVISGKEGSLKTVSLTVENGNVVGNATASFVEGNSAILFAKRTSYYYSKNPESTNCTITSYDINSGMLVLDNPSTSCQITFPTQCFVAGTQILTDNGYKNIEKIKQGDLVMPFGKTGIEAKEIIKVIKSSTNVIYQITVGGKTIKTTPRHQFFVYNKDYVRAKDLHVGDYLVTKENRKIKINKIKIIKYKKDIATYNLEVKDNHNYFVSSLDLLVHNPGSLT